MEAPRQEECPRNPKCLGVAGDYAGGEANVGGKAPLTFWKLLARPPGKHSGGGGALHSYSGLGPAGCREHSAGCVLRHWYHWPGTGPGESSCPT